MHPFSLTEEQIDAVSGAAASYTESELSHLTTNGYGTIGWPCILTWGIGEAGGPLPDSRDMM
ncbi:hypothetical protein [Massilia sp. ST3]|uniref:hypothetical protein n=1 Tax=Massilia sp. ST3 TaxID=2824903 RepID=UPI001B83A92A|nr:hypothetical protein [Massilia sp. ST3]MBQ5947270.1 hypothetical protein [Massilia sp. ST3]